MQAPKTRHDLLAQVPGRAAILKSVQDLVDGCSLPGGACPWHSRALRSELERIHNCLRGTPAAILTRAGTWFWCSCAARSSGKAPAFLRVFGTDDSDCEKVAKWERACEPIVERWASAIQKGASLEEVDNLSAERKEKTYWAAVERAIGNTRLMPSRKPRFLTAKGSVPCPADLIGAFVGKAGATIRALEHRLGARQMDRKTGRPRGHFHSRIVLTVNEDRTISFVAPACRAADVEASIRAQIAALEFRLRAYRERQIQREIWDSDAEGRTDSEGWDSADGAAGMARKRRRSGSTGCRSESVGQVASPGRTSSADDAEVNRAIELSLSEPCSAQEEDEYLNRAIQESLSPSFTTTSEPPTRDVGPEGLECAIP